MEWLEEKKLNELAATADITQDPVNLKKVLGVDLNLGVGADMNTIWDTLMRNPEFAAVAKNRVVNPQQDKSATKTTTPTATATPAPTQTVT